MAQYFNRDTDIALEKFLLATDPKEKHEVFDKGIRPAFEKLVENLIFVYGFYSLDDVETLKREGLSNLYEMIPKFDPTKGTKGFSYFNVVAKNWFIQKSKERNKKNRIESELHVDLDHETAVNDPNFAVAPYEDQVEERERWIMFYEAMESWRGRLTKKTETQVLEAVIFIMRNPDLVPIYNKKAVYLYLRELTSLNTKQVVVNLKKIKALYDEWKNGYDENGSIYIGKDDDGSFRGDPEEYEE
jgi:hypothetical protein